jgi:hypothetical protein
VSVECLGFERWLKDVFGEVFTLEVIQSDAGGNSNSSQLPVMIIDRGPGN